MQRFMPTRDQSQFQHRLQERMEQEKIDAMILTTSESIFYATGYISCLYGRGESIGTDIAVVPATGRVKLIVSQFTQGGAELQTKGEVDVVSYPTYMFIEDYYDPNETEKPAQSNLFRTFDMATALVAECAPVRPTVGVERSSLSYDRFRYLMEQYGEAHLVNVEQLLLDLRSVKLPWEIDVLRHAAQTEERMMNFTMQNTEIGMTEADINRMWWQSAYEISGGHEIFNVRQAHSVGPDFWCTVMARERPLENGDLVRLDGGLTLYGYMSDLGRVYAVGDKVSDRQKALFDTLLKAYDVGIGMMEPGVRMCDIFAAVMKVCKEGAIPNFVRGHVGHTVGLGPGEDAPIISATNCRKLEPGMVLCFEVPYYSSANGSYNMEDTLVITENGHELFTNTNRTLFIQ